MQEVSRYAVGLDVGTTTVRCVVGHVDAAGQTPTIIGVSEYPNNGMRKGTVVNLVNAAQAIDKALEIAERMSGHQIHAATVSVNGSHVVGMSSRGVIAVGTGGHEINEDDLARVEEAATVVQLPANREILEVTPRSYQLDGQDNIKDPIGMTGVRLEVDAHVITALGPHLKNLLKACEMTETVAHRTVLTGLASARAVVSERQMENGVVLIDLGGTTTNIAVFDEGDLQHVAVLPVGSVNITNDLAIGLKTDLDIAEQVKIQHAVAVPKLRKDNKPVVVKIDKESHEFDPSDVDMIVDARLEEIFELINKELKSIGRAAKLPGGAVITGGGAQLRGIEEYAKEALQVSARLGVPTGYGGVSEKIANPGYSSAVGLMLLDLEGGAGTIDQRKEKSGGVDIGAMIGSVGNKVTGIFNKFRS
ncbi:cell division protein FtsA [Pedobacter sp.]|nr:cell division protein FtsA [Candidatus Saccharibacteria bacterium]